MRAANVCCSCWPPPWLYSKLETCSRGTRTSPYLSHELIFPCEMAKAASRSKCPCLKLCSEFCRTVWKWAGAETPWQVGGQWGGEEMVPGRGPQEGRAEEQGW